MITEEHGGSTFRFWIQSSDHFLLPAKFSDLECMEKKHSSLTAKRMPATMGVSLCSGGDIASWTNSVHYGKCREDMNATYFFYQLDIRIWNTSCYYLAHKRRFLKLTLTLLKAVARTMTACRDTNGAHARTRRRTRAYTHVYMYTWIYT